MTAPPLDAKPLAAGPPGNSTENPQGWSARRPIVLGLLASGLLVVGFGGWAATARLEGAVIAPARVAVLQDRQIVQHPEGGVVSAIAVAEGESVAAGAVLMRLDPGAGAFELAIVESHYLETLARLGRLAAERDGLPAPVPPPDLARAMDESGEARTLAEGQERLFRARRDALARQLAQLDQRRQQARAQVEGLTAQAAATEAELQLLAQELDVQERLQAQGLTQAARLAALRRDAARLEGTRGALAADIARVQGLLAELAQQALAMQADYRAGAEAEMRDAGIRALELAERRAALAERMARLTLRAPVAGRVHGLAITTPGAVLQPAQPALYLVPQDRPLLLNARIRPEDIRAVRPGQTVMVQILAPGMREAGLIPAHVAQVSADAFDDAPGTPGAPRHFRAELRFEPGALDRLGAAPLLPGMAAEVYIQTGTRSALAYLTDPLRATLQRAWREP